MPTINSNKAQSLVQEESYSVMKSTDKLQDAFLQDLLESQYPVFVYLINGIKLEGKLKAIDRHCVVLGGHSRQLLYKHSISTIMPAHDDQGRHMRSGH